jgi:hypothetical protein
MRFFYFCLMMNLFFGEISFSQTTGNTDGSSELPFTLVNNRIFITIYANGTPRNFMLDIGASGIGRIDQRIVKEMRLDTVGYEASSDGVNTVQRPLVGLKTLKVGNVTLNDVSLMSRDYNVTTRDTLTDGIIGRGFFEDYLLILDYPNKKIIFRKGKLDPKGKNVLTYERPFRVKGKIGSKEYEFYLDSGSSLDFHFPRNVISTLKHDITGEIRVARRANTEFELHGVVVKQELQLGNIRLSKFKAYYSDIQPWINVGGVFLQSYKVTIDQKNKCLTLE